MVKNPAIERAYLLVSLVAHPTFQLTFERTQISFLEPQKCLFYLIRRVCHIFLIRGTTKKPNIIFASFSLGSPSAVLTRLGLT